MNNKTQHRISRGTGDHIPVLLHEVLNYLRIRKGKKYIDATVGMGGHALEIERLGGRILGIDRDRASIEKLKVKIKKHALNRPTLRRTGLGSKIQVKSLKLIHGNFTDLEEIARKHGFVDAAGILFDLGLSSWQIEKAGRGFSFWRDELLDMRLDRNKDITAADILNHSTQQALYEIFSKFGEEQYSGRIAQAVLGARPITTTGQLRKVVEKAIGRGSEGKIKRVARIFQALRIATNDELKNLSLVLPQALELLQFKGRLLVISFHSLEDRIVKQFFKECVRNQRGKILTKKAVRPTHDEIKRNKRAASAKLRVLEKN